MKRRSQQEEKELWLQYHSVIASRSNSILKMVSPNVYNPNPDSIPFYPLECKNTRYHYAPASALYLPKVSPSPIQSNKAAYITETLSDPSSQ